MGARDLQDAGALQQLWKALAGAKRGQVVGDPLSPWVFACVVASPIITRIACDPDDKTERLQPDAMFPTCPLNCQQLTFAISPV